MPIESVEDGWVEWLQIGDGQNYRAEKLHLVHDKSASPLKGSDWGCQYPRSTEFDDTGYTVANLPLDYFVGADGLMQLLRLWEEGLPQTEVKEMIKRLHIPGYERARHYFKEAIAAGAFEPNTPLGYHYQYQIEATLRYVDERDKR